MPIHLTDEEIQSLVTEPKPVAKNWFSRLKPRPKPGHEETQLDITGSQGSEFRVMIRKSLINVLDFSVILGCCPKGSNVIFRLRRYNGKSHEHTNLIEKTSFYDFHIHEATLRYQEIGLREDFFANPTARYADLDSAIHCLMADCNIKLPVPEPPPLLALLEGK